jgi:hypothetical protein
MYDKREVHFPCTGNMMEESTCMDNIVYCILASCYIIFSVVWISSKHVPICFKMRVMHTVPKFICQTLYIKPISYPNHTKLFVSITKFGTSSLDWIQLMSKFLPEDGDRIQFLKCYVLNKTKG